jgi:sigma-B regulation protein RsbU (phosphoserine phosphatase)
MEMPDRKAVERIGTQLKSTLFMSGPLDLGELRCLEGHILHSSAHPDVCGDFHTVKIINESTVGLLLVDGEGHALTGLLNALPMIATAEAFGGDSGSSRHLMDKLMSMSNDLGVRGNALYCTFTLIERSVWLSATSAGNVHLLLIRRHPGFEARQFPAPGDPARGTSLGFRLRIPLAEAHEKLHPGDILIGYTDGITDALGVQPELEAGTLARLALEPSLESAQEIAAAVMKPAGGSPLSDDATVFVIKVA